MPRKWSRMHLDSQNPRTFSFVNDSQYTVSQILGKEITTSDAKLAIQQVLSLSIASSITMYIAS